MLQREAELRLCKETQQLYEKAERSADTDWMEVTDQLQRRVIREFEYHEDEEQALFELRTAAVLHPEEPEFKNHTTLCEVQQGKERCGDRAPDVELIQMDGLSKIKLSQFASNRPLVLFAGSYS